MLNDFKLKNFKKPIRFLAGALALSLMSSTGWVGAAQQDSIPGRVLGGINFSNSDWKTTAHVLTEGAWQADPPPVVTSAPLSPAKQKPLQVTYPKYSSSPASHRNYNTPLGGGQFAADFNLSPKRTLGLDYYVYFPSNFQFNKGGKLPGLYGGSVSQASGGRYAEDSFSTRLMWRADGQGELYVYFPNPQVGDLGKVNGDMGVSIGRGSFAFTPGTWTHVRQLIHLTNSSSDRLRLWINDMNTPVIDIRGTQFSHTVPLSANGLFFSTFFGGSDSSWGSPANQHAYFADFKIWEP